MIALLCQLAVETGALRSLCTPSRRDMRDSHAPPPRGLPLGNRDGFDAQVTLIHTNGEHWVWPRIDCDEVAVV